MSYPDKRRDAKGIGHVVRDDSLSRYVQFVAITANCSTRGCATRLCGCRGAAGIVMVVMPFVDWFKVGLEACEGFLRSRKIAGSQRGGKTFIVRVRLAVLAEDLGGSRLRYSLEILLECCQRSLRGCKVARLQGATDGFEILTDLARILLIRNSIGVGIGRYGGDAAHIYSLMNVLSLASLRVLIGQKSTGL